MTENALQTGLGGLGLAWLGLVCRSAFSKV
jgi:hypothetical protein